MAVLVNADTRVICQGFTGRTATFHCDRMMAYGTTIVGGVVPGKGGRNHLDLPVFEDVATARTETGADATLVFVPPENAASAIIEAIEAETPLAVCVTERVPVLDMVRVRQALAGSKTTLVGANSQGILAPGIAQLGVMSTVDARPGRIGIASRSASLTSEIVLQTTKLGLGQSTTIGVGGDPIHGLGLPECVDLFLDDPDTDGIILIGEIGGREEQEAAERIAARRSARGPGSNTGPADKPVVAYVAGRHAPKERRMGHAGALAEPGTEASAEAKIEAFQAAGVIIPPDAATVGETMAAAMAAAQDARRA